MYFSCWWVIGNGTENGNYCLGFGAPGKDNGNEGPGKGKWKLLPRA